MCNVRWKSRLVVGWLVVGWLLVLVLVLLPVSIVKAFLVLGYRQSVSIVIVVVIVIHSINSMPCAMPSFNKQTQKHSNVIKEKKEERVWEFQV